MYLISFFSIFLYLLPSIFLFFLLLDYSKAFYFLSVVVFGVFSPFRPQMTAGYEAEVMCRAEAWANANVLPLTYNKEQVRVSSPVTLKNLCWRSVELAITHLSIVYDLTSRL